MLNEVLVRELERGPDTTKKPQKRKRGTVYNKCPVDFRAALVQAAITYMQNHEGSAPSTLDEITAVAGYSRWAIFKYPPQLRPTLEEVLTEALKLDHIAAEIGALIAKRKGIK